MTGCEAINSVCPRKLPWTDGDKKRLPERRQILQALRGAKVTHTVNG